MTAEIQTPAQVAEPAAATEETRNIQTYRPPVDILERADDLVIVADVPGASADKLAINFENGSLVIHGEVPRRQGKETSFLLQEYGVGDFHREFHVSEAVEATKITAEYHDGVLVVRLPKVEAAKPRKISVKSA